MKKILISHYALFMAILFVFYNIVLDNLKVRGLAYQIIVSFMIIFNFIVFWKFGGEIKYKGLVIIIYFFIWIFSKDIYQCLWDFENIIILCIVGFKNSNFIKVLAILIALFVVSFFWPLCFVFLFAFGINYAGEIRDIYEDTHYSCDNNMEAYAYSAGAMDKFHYSVGKYYEIVNINGIIQITYEKRKESTKSEYNEYIKNHKCTLVGDKNGLE